LHPVLDVGNEYWLVALATDPSTVAVWNLNNIGEGATLAFSYTGGATWTLTAFPATVPAFDVLGTAIPEPGFWFPVAARSELYGRYAGLAQTPYER
jgi:hypothetical protein